MCHVEEKHTDMPLRKCGDVRLFCCLLAMRQEIKKDGCLLFFPQLHSPHLPTMSQRSSHLPRFMVHALCND